MPTRRDTKISSAGTQSRSRNESRFSHHERSHGSHGSHSSCGSYGGSQDISGRDPYLRTSLADSALPEGWEAVQSGVVNRVYYFCKMTQLIVWHRSQCFQQPPQLTPPPSLPAGWTAIWCTQENGYYFYNPHTEETSWELPAEDEENPPPPTGPPPPPPEGKRDSRPAFIQDVLRPKYGDGKLLREPGLVESLFVYMVNNASQRHIIFYEFFLNCFKNEIMLQQLLKNGWWKRCLLVMISENDANHGAMDYKSMSHNEVLDYVLLTLTELFAYFFNHFDERKNHVLQLGSTDLALPLGLSGKVTMHSFLMDVVNEFTQHRMQALIFKVLQGFNGRVCDWQVRPPWVTDVTCVEWLNLFSGLEAQEELLFFHQKEFVLPNEGVSDFAGLGVLESAIVLLERVKAQSLDELYEVDPAAAKLQKAYSARVNQECEFYVRMRDFFRYIGDMDSCMDKGVFRTHSPPHCSQAEVCQLLAGRKKPNYGSSSSVQKKLSAYISRYVEHYKKVFAGEAQLPPRPDFKPLRAVPSITQMNSGSKIGLSSFLRHSKNASRQSLELNSNNNSSSNSNNNINSGESPMHKKSLFARRK